MALPEEIKARIKKAHDSKMPLRLPFDKGMPDNVDLNELSNYIEELTGKEITEKMLQASQQKVPLVLPFNKLDNPKPKPKLEDINKEKIKTSDRIKQAFSMSWKMLGEIADAAEGVISDVGDVIESGFELAGKTINKADQLLKELPEKTNQKMREENKGFSVSSNELLDKNINTTSVAKEFEKAANEFSKAVPGGMLSGVTFGMAGKSFEEQPTTSAKIGHVTGAILGAIPAIIAAEMTGGVTLQTTAGLTAAGLGATRAAIPTASAAARLLAARETGALVLSTLTPLSRSVLQNASAGIMFGGMAEAARGGWEKFVDEPIEVAKEATKEGLIWAAFAPLDILLGKLFSSIKGNTATDAITKYRETVQTVETLERARWSDLTWINPEQYGFGEKPMPTVDLIPDLEALKIKIAKARKFRESTRIKGPKTAKKFQKYAKRLKDDYLLDKYVFTFEDTDKLIKQNKNYFTPKELELYNEYKDTIVNSMNSYLPTHHFLKNKNVDLAPRLNELKDKLYYKALGQAPDRAELYSARSKKQMEKQLKKELETYAHMHVTDEDLLLYNEFGDLIDEAAKRELDFETLIFDKHRKRYTISFKPNNKWEKAYGEMPEVSTLHKEFIADVMPDARIIKATLHPQDKNLNIEFFNEVVLKKIEREYPVAASEGPEALAEFTKNVQRLKDNPVEWQKEVQRYANAYGYDAIDWGGKGVTILDSSRIKLSISKNTETAKTLMKGFPKLMTDETVIELPMLKGVFHKTPSPSVFNNKFIEIAQKEAKGGKPVDIDKVIEDTKEYFNYQLKVQKEGVHKADPSVQVAAERLRNANIDINPVTATWTDLAHAADSISSQFPEESRILMRLALDVKRAEVDAAHWATKQVKHIYKRFEDVGIKAGSKESALFQRYGEWSDVRQEIEDQIIKLREIGNIKEAEKLSKQMIEEKKKLDEFMTPERKQLMAEVRELYDFFLDKVLNPIRKLEGKEPIPKRDNYFRHFQDLNNMVDLYGGILNIPDSEVGKSYIKNNRPLFTAELERKGGQYIEDAVGGLRNYIQGMANVMFLKDPVGRLRDAAKYFPKNFRRLMNLTADSAIGKRFEAGESPVPKFIDFIVHNKLFRILNRNVISNTIIGNLGTALAQVNSLPVLIAEVGERNVFKALHDIYVSNLSYARRAMARSVSPSVASHKLNLFDLGHIDETTLKKTLNLPLEMLDNEMSQLGFWAGWHRGNELGLKGNDLVLYADRVAQFVNATYTNSATPAYMRDNLIRLIMPLHRQINNIWSTAVFSFAKDLYGKSTPVKILLSPKIYKMWAYGVTMNIMIKGFLETLGIEHSREFFEITDLIPLYNIFTYGVYPLVVKQGKNIASGGYKIAAGALEGDTKRMKKGAWQAAKGYVMLGAPTIKGVKTVGHSGAKVATKFTTHVPYGAKQIISILEGYPFGREKR